MGFRVWGLGFRVLGSGCRIYEYETVGYYMEFRGTMATYNSAHDPNVIRGSLSYYMTGRIVLSHVHVFTLRRTRSTEKLISTGLASGGIITLE